MAPATLTASLAPFLPTLLNLGAKAATSTVTKVGDTAGTKLTESALNKASAIWEKLFPKVAAKEDAKLAAEQVAAKPDSPAWQAVLQEELELLLKENPDLAAAIAKIMEEDAPDGTPGTQIVQNVTGNQNQVFGQVTGGQVFGNVSGMVVTGETIHSRTAPAADLTSNDKDTSLGVKTILVLAANPKGTDPLRLGEEVRKIQAGLERSQYRSRFRIEQRWAATPMDVRCALLDCKPQIIHFSGHGVGHELGDGSTSTRKLTAIPNSATEPEGLMFEDETGQIKLVSGDAIANLFALFSDQIEFVVLNACYSEVQATAIGQHIPYVVGMKRAIGDQAAIEFAVGFYDAILATQLVGKVYKLGCSAILMAGIPEHLTPTIHRKPV